MIVEIHIIGKVVHGYFTRDSKFMYFDWVNECVDSRVSKQPNIRNNERLGSIQKVRPQNLTVFDFPPPCVHKFWPFTGEN